MTAFKLKLIALVAMFLDHAAVVFPEHIPLEFRAIGRLAFPIFAYLLAEGFRYTKAPEKFLLRLFAFAIISEFPFDLATSGTINFSQTQTFSTHFFSQVQRYAFMKNTARKSHKH
jgi:hypothetical protein